MAASRGASARHGMDRALATAGAGLEGVRRASRMLRARGSGGLPLRESVLLGLIVLIAIGLRVGWILYANVNPLDGRFDDTVFYFKSADSLAHHFQFRDEKGVLTAHWPPGYSLMLTPLFVLFGESLLAAKLLNVAFGAATCVLTYTLGARVFTRGVGLLAALIMALFPGQILFSTLVMTEVAFGFLFLLVVLLFLVWTLERRQPSRLQLVLLGVAVAAAALVRSEAVFLALTLPLLWGVLLRSWRTALRYSLPFLAGFVLVLTPWTVRNALQFHRFIPLRTSGNLLGAALDPTYPDQDHFFTRPPTLDETLPPILHHPWMLVPLQLRKVELLYRSDADGIYWVQGTLAVRSRRPVFGEAVADRLRKASTIYYFEVGGLALLAVPFASFSMDRRVAGLIGIAMAWTAIETIAWPEARYHFPLTPLLCVFAAAFALTLWDQLIRLCGSGAKRRTPFRSSGM